MSTNSERIAYHNQLIDQAKNKVDALPDYMDTSDATALESHILAGYTAYVNGEKLTGTIPSRAAQVLTPGTVAQTIEAGVFLSGAQTIEGDANLLAENIKSGVSIFGVDGLLEAVGGSKVEWLSYTPAETITTAERSTYELCETTITEPTLIALWRMTGNTEYGTGIEVVSEEVISYIGMKYNSKQGGVATWHNSDKYAHYDYSASNEGFFNSDGAGSSDANMYVREGKVCWNSGMKILSHEVFNAGVTYCIVVVGE